MKEIKVKIEDWMYEDIKSCADHYDISFSEMVRYVIAVCKIDSVKYADKSFKTKLSIKNVIAFLLKKGHNEKVFWSEELSADKKDLLEKLREETYSEARRAHKITQKKGIKLF